MSKVQVFQLEPGYIWCRVRHALMHLGLHLEETSKYNPRSNMKDLSKLEIIYDKVQSLLRESERHKDLTRAMRFDYHALLGPKVVKQLRSKTIQVLRLTSQGVTSNISGPT